MTTNVTLMVVPAVGVPNNPPQFFLAAQSGQSNGARTETVWRDLGYSEGVSQPLAEIRQTIEQRFNEVMGYVEHGNAPEGWGFLKDVWYDELYDPLMPEPVRLVLDQAVYQANSNGEVPTLRIHVTTDFDWIPWEIMHDRTAYLGLRFQIARLPIVEQQVPDLSDNVTHPVESIMTMLGDLGQGVLNDDLWEAWKTTFSSLDPQAAAQVEERRIPPDRMQGPWPLDKDLETAVSSDILHFTCHGGIESQQTGGAFWALNYDQMVFPWYKITTNKVQKINLGSRRPLVFGNACSSAAGAGAAHSNRGVIDGFGPTFFASGAVAFIGTFAPIRTQLAFDFARQFYKRLLGEGLSVAEALRATKVFYQDENNPDPSWLFYCLYGPPDTRFAFGKPNN
jgi:hypothetical protein